MYHREHGVPHFHAAYSGHRASISIDTLEVLGGSLPDRALRLVREWAELHREEFEAKLGTSRRPAAPGANRSAALAFVSCKNSSMSPRLR
jgi:hypothetical protein